MYWHQAKTFAQVGFANGYYSWDENPARLGGYYTWGAAIPMFYGALMRVFGDALNVIPLLHYGLLSVALLAWVLLSRPTSGQSLLYALFFATFAPVTLYNVTSMTVTLHVVTAIALAAGFVYVWQHPQNRRALLMLGALLCVVTQLRLTWAVFCLPYALLWVRGRRWHWKLLAMLLGGVSGVGLAWLMFSTGAPYPHFFNQQPSVSHLLAALVENVLKNLRWMYVGWANEAIIRYLCFGALAYLGVLVWRMRRHPDATLRWAVYTSAFSLLSVMGVVFALYIVNAWNDYRIFATHLLFVLLVLAAFRRYLLMIITIASMLVLLPETLEIYDQWTQDHLVAERSAHVAYWQEQFAGVLAYDPDAPNAWCNTLSHSVTFLYEDADVLLAVPAGIGLSSPLFHIATLPYKARWLLIENGSYERRKAYLNVRPLLEVQNGRLYENLDTLCQQP